MAITQDQFNAFFTAHPNATTDQVAAAVQSIGGLDANAGLADMLAGRYGIDTSQVQNHYNAFTSSPAGIANTPGMGVQGIGVQDAGVGSPVAQPVAPTDNWMPGQWYNPNVMPENFDWQRYVGANQDLGAAGIDTQIEAMRHYFNYGRNENRNIGALAPTRAEDLSPEDYRAGLTAYRQATGNDFVLTGVNGEASSEYAPANQWITQNYIPQGKFTTDYTAAKPIDTFKLLDQQQTSNRPPEQLATIQKAWEANKDNPAEMRRLMEENGVTLGDLSQATGETYSQLNTWVKGGNVLGAVGFSVNQPGAYDKYKQNTTPKYDPDAKTVAGPSTAASREADYIASQKRADNIFDAAFYAKDPEGYIKFLKGENKDVATNLKSSFGTLDAKSNPSTEGILAGFRYAKDNGIGESTMKKALGEDVFNTYKSGLANYAKTGIANIFADKKLSFEEARETVNFGRALGYDTQKLADLTGTDKKVFDDIQKRYEDTSKRVISETLKEGPEVKSGADQIYRSLALQKQYGFSDEDLAKATNLSVSQVKGYLDPVKNFDVDYKKLIENPNRSEDQIKEFFTASMQNPFLKEKLGDKFQPVLDELNRPPRERMMDQIGAQREALGGQYYQGIFGDPKTMVDILEKKGVKSLGDLGEKDKFQEATAVARYTTESGRSVSKIPGGGFMEFVASGDDGEWRKVPSDQVKTTYGKYVTGPDGESSEFKPLSEAEQATLKDGKFQDKIGTVVINKRTGDEITDTTHQLAYQRSSGGLKEKKNYLNVDFDKNGTAVLTASKQRAGLGGFLQDIAPFAAMVLPFVLPGIGTALSGMLPGAAVAATGTAAAIPATLINKALTQGIINGTLTTLGGGKFGKGFVGGMATPFINAGIGSLLPSGLSENATRAIKGAGTGAFKSLVDGGSFTKSLGQGILSGGLDYGLGELTKGLNLSPQQLKFATGIALPALQGQKVNPMKLLTTLASMDQQQRKGRKP